MGLFDILFSEPPISTTTAVTEITSTPEQIDKLSDIFDLPEFSMVTSSLISTTSTTTTWELRLSKTALYWLCGVAIFIFAAVTFLMVVWCKCLKKRHARLANVVLPLEQSAPFIDTAVNSSLAVENSPNVEDVTAAMKTIYRAGISSDSFITGAPPTRPPLPVPPFVPVSQVPLLERERVVLNITNSANVESGTNTVSFRRCKSDSKNDCMFFIWKFKIRHLIHLK